VSGRRHGPWGVPDDAPERDFNADGSVGTALNPSRGRGAKRSLVPEHDRLAAYQ
jgi:hypothetical protein